MDAVSAQAVSLQDLPWLIRHDPERCIACGKCAAACTFDAIYPAFSLPGASALARE